MEAFRLEALALWTTAATATSTLLLWNVLIMNALTVPIAH